MVTLVHLLEAAALWLLFAVLRALPLDTASASGGWLARIIGPRLKAQHTAKRNLAVIFPEKSEAECNAIITRMWENLGRTAAELSHLGNPELLRRVDVQGAANLPEGKQLLFFSGHLGNWELLPMISASQGHPVALAYRKANNPLADSIINRLRALHCSHMFPKGPSGAVKVVRALKSGQSLAMLVDQKMNDGIAVPFFGREAMTAPAIAQFALRYDMPIIPARVVRKSGAHFIGEVCPPLAYKKTGDEQADMLAIMSAINAILENWIREYPEQWFWVHKRWPN